MTSDGALAQAVQVGGHRGRQDGFPVVFFLVDDGREITQEPALYQEQCAIIPDNPSYSDLHAAIRGRSPSGVFKVGEFLPAAREGFRVGTLPVRGRVGKFAARQRFVVRSGENLGHHDGPGLWFDRYQPQVQEGMDVGSQWQSVADYVAVGTAVGTKVGSLQYCGGVAAGDSAFAAVGVQQGRVASRIGCK
jgi:hypothetical protein